MAWLEALRRIKSNSGLSIREISDLSGVPEPTLEKLFAGQTKNPGINSIQQLVHALGYTLDDIDDAVVTTQKSPSAEESAPGDQVTLEESNRLLVALGYIQEGDDLSDQDLAFLSHIVGLLDAWFRSKGQ